jgi:hypothetical protein
MNGPDSNVIRRHRHVFDSIAIIVGVIFGCVSLIASFMTLSITALLVPLLIFILALLSSHWKKASTKSIANFSRVFFWSAFIAQVCSVAFLFIVIAFHVSW